MNSRGLRLITTLFIVSALGLSPVSHALEIELGESVTARSFSDDRLHIAGELAAGSVVDIPDQYVVRPGGVVDTAATFNHWLSQAGYKRSQIGAPISDAKHDFYFPVKVRKAQNEEARDLVGQTLMISLRVLARTQDGLKVLKTSHVYRPPADQAPVKPGLAVPTPRADFNTNEAQAPCADCAAHHGSEDSGAQTAQALGSTVRDEIAPAVFNREAQGRQGLTPDFPKACESFIEPDGSYGPWGEIAVTEISQDPETFLNAKGIESVCPNFNKPEFDEAEKRHFWVWLLASVAAQESSCNPNKDSHEFKRVKKGHRWVKVRNMVKRGGRFVRFNPNGIASGLLQIEKNPILRAARDRRYRGAFCSGNPYKPKVNIRCGIRMLKSIIDDEAGPFSREDRYWSSLADEGLTAAKELISQYGTCGAQPIRLGQTRSKKRTSPRSAS